MKHFFRHLKVILTKQDRKFLLALLIFSIFISIIEMIGISAIMPFLSMINDQNIIETNEYIAFTYNLFSFEDKIDFIFIFGLVLIGFYILRSVFNIVYQYYLAKFSQGRFRLFAFRLFKNYLGLDYQTFIGKNSGELTKAIISEADNLTHFIYSFLLLISESIILILLYALMLYVDWKVTLVISLVLGIQAIFLIKLIQNKIRTEGIKRAKYQENIYEILNSSFGNFKIIKLISTQDKIFDKFLEKSHHFAQSNIINLTLSNIPRLIIEGIGFILIIAVVLYYIYIDRNNLGQIIPTISVFVLVLYRLLPSTSRIISNYNTMVFLYRSFEIVHNDLTYEIETFGDDKIEFQDKIVLENIFFSYDNKTTTLNDINLTINKGRKIALVGESGSGKSTLIDIIMGFYKPKDGILKVDNNKIDTNNLKSFRDKIGYIPQNIYLFDGDVASNVVFDREYDEDKIIDSLKKAKIWGLLKSKNGLSTKVGEGGIQLSGGQKQRIAIARAIYSNPDILILDEATSALDSQVEEEIMDEIYELSQDKTLIIVTHRLSTIEKCEKIYKIENKRLKEYRNE